MSTLKRALYCAAFGLPIYILYRTHFPDASTLQTSLVAFISAQLGIIYANA